MGKLHIKACDWGDDLVDQMIRFPTAKHDDQVDALANLGLSLDQTEKAQIPYRRRPRKPYPSLWVR